MMFEEVNAWDWDHPQKTFKSLALQNKWPFFSWKYFVRIIFWRFFEISSRVCLLLLIWSSMGGLSLIIVLGLDLAICIYICFKEKSFDLIGMMMYLSFSASGDYIALLWLYR